MQHRSDVSPVLARSIQKALGDARTRRLDDLDERVQELDSWTHNVGTTDVVLMPMKQFQVSKWIEKARSRGEDWVFAESSDGRAVFAVDEPSDQGQRDPMAAVVYPEMHMRLVSWWLFHTWRGVDLLRDALDSLCRWRISSTAVTARALIEETGCLVYETEKFVTAWKDVKASNADDVRRTGYTRVAMKALLDQVGFGSRIEGRPDALRATNVLTYVKKLAKGTGDPRFLGWYDWLSDAAHPAFGARIAQATQPLGHESRALTVRSYSRSPLMLVDADGEATAFENPIATKSSDAIIASAAVLLDVLDQSLRLVDDFGLTTRAATYTRRWYWRNFTPVRGSRACPCGRGPWSSCGHWWAGPTPALDLPRTETLC